MEMRVLAYNEGKFIISKDLTADSIKGKQVQINIAPVLKYRDEDDVVGALLNIDFSLDEKTILFLGMVVSVYVKDFRALLNELGLDRIKKELMPLWDVALGMARGILTEKTKGSPLEHQFLPVVDLERFADVAVLVKEPITNKEPHQIDEATVTKG